MSDSAYVVLIDGYNVIKRHPDWCQAPLDQARQRLVVAVQHTRWPVPVSRIEVLFDSKSLPAPPLCFPSVRGIAGEPLQLSDVVTRSVRDKGAGPAVASSQVAHIRVAFASPSADAAIQQAIQTSARPHRLIVISDDRAIMDTAKSHGTLRYAASWLLNRSQPKRAPVEPEPDRPRVAESAARRINAELAKRWGLGGTLHR